MLFEEQALRMLSIVDDSPLQQGIPLPTEVLADVLSLCGRHSLASLCISCKRLSAIAERELYKSLTIPCLDRGERLNWLELVSRSLFNGQDNSIRLGYVKELTFKSLSCKFLYASSDFLGSTYLEGIQRLLSHVHSLTALTIVFATNDIADYDLQIHPTLLLTSIRLSNHPCAAFHPAPTFSNLHSFTFDTQFIDNSIVSSFLNRHPTLEHVSIGNGVTKLTIIGPTSLPARGDCSESIVLPRLKSFTGPERYFRCLSASAAATFPDCTTASSMTTPIAPGLREARITWEHLSDFTLALQPIIAANSSIHPDPHPVAYSNGCKFGGREEQNISFLKCTRPGSNIDLIQYIAERLPWLRKFQVMTFMGHRIDSMFDVVTQEKMLAIADAVMRFPHLKEFEYFNWVSVLIIGPAHCHKLGKVFMERIGTEKKLALRRCKLFGTEWVRAEALEGKPAQWKPEMWGLL